MRLGSALAVLLVAVPAFAEDPVALAPKDALVGESIGPFASEDFRLAPGRCADCPASPAALWYFQDDLLAVPKPGVAVATIDSARGRKEEVAAFDRSFVDGADLPRPPLVWIGSPQVLEHARPGFTLAPRLASNRSWYDASSEEFFGKRPLRLRGRTTATGFEARAVWPEDFVLETASEVRPLRAKETVSSLVTQPSPSTSQDVRVLWQKPGRDRSVAGKPVLAVVLNGAQGDDDEAMGGHFAIATGRLGPHGEWHSLLVNNFYGLDSVSEKGIVASMTPMDAYMGDLNSGQAFYRPSWVLVIVLDDPRTAWRYQGAVTPVYEHFYRHDFAYHHSAANCAGISMDVLRGVGWRVPTTGPTGRLKASAGFFYMAVKERSVAGGVKAYDYVAEERTRLFPRAAFEESARDILRIVDGSRRDLSPYEQQLRDDVAAVLLVRVPQFPSSRATGSWPVASLDEYGRRVPKDRAQWKIVPVPPRPFPVALREGRPVPAAPRSNALLVASGTAAVVIGALGVGARWAVRRRRERARPAPPAAP